MSNSINLTGSYKSLANFAVVTVGNIQNAGNTNITGNIGVSELGATISGFPPGICTGRKDLRTIKSMDATGQLQQLYNIAFNFSGTTLPSGNLGPAYGPGTYKTTSNMFIDGTVTLTGTATDQFFFIAGNPMFFGNTTPANIVLSGGAVEYNVFWITSSGILYKNSTIKGILIASASIFPNTPVTGSTITGAVYSRTSVTLQNDTIVAFTPPIVPVNSVVFPGTDYVDLGNYAVLTNNFITSTGNTVITGNIGVIAQGSNTISGFPPGTCTGRQDLSTIKANAAYAQLGNLYDRISIFTGTELTSSALAATYSPGTYTYTGDITVDGIITLTGSATDQFFFIVTGNITFGQTTPVGITLADETLSENVFWLAGNSINYYGGLQTDISGIMIAKNLITENPGGSRLTGALYSQLSIDLKTNEILAFNSVIIPCYMKGTQILTEHGYRNIETIKVGDMIKTFGEIDDSEVIPGDNKLRICVSIEKRTVDVPNKETGVICFNTCSLGEYVPESRLYVSPDHGIVVNGYLMAAKHLINGLTIFQDLTKQDIEYYHIELESHSCIKANGALADSFRR